MLKILFIIMGIVLTSIGLSNIILYLNLLVLGYNFFDYLKYMFTNFFTIIFWLGLVLIYLGIKMK